MGKGGYAGGGGGGGSNIGVGAGSAGTSFSGGSGSGGTYYPIENTTGTDNAEANGGAGSDSVLLGVVPAGNSAAGAGNPNGSVSLGPSSTYDGTGGVLIIFVEGTITTQGASVKHFTADGVAGRQMTQSGMAGTAVYPFGGGTGGGIVILVNKNATSLVNNVSAYGGVVVNNSPNDPEPYRSAGNGSAICIEFNQL